MKVSDFDYILPDELIAQNPVEPRDTSRLMILNRKSRNIEHRIFRDIVEYLNPKDLLVLNNTRVIPARLFAKKANSTIEVLLVEKIGTNLWNCMVKPGKKVKPGDILNFETFTAECLSKADQGMRTLKFETTDEDLLKLGEAPLPPYVHSKIPIERYQTIYAKINGAIASPTAGLHFTEELLRKIKSIGVTVTEITLHVGIGTFRPVKTQFVQDHKMHPERYQISQDTVKLIEKTKRSGGRVIATGTTVVRALEEYGINGKLEGETRLFIYPPFNFKIVDAMITNFHLPKSTLLMLVAAFAGYDFIMEAYREAIEKRYRFYSFGDAMFIT